MIKMMEEKCYLCKEASNQKSLESGPPLKCRKLGVLGGTKTKFRALGDLLKELSLLKHGWYWKIMLDLLKCESLG